MSRKNIQHEDSSVPENIYRSSSLLDCKDEANTNKPEAASIFDICTEIHPTIISTENSLSEEPSANTELETAKTECPDGNSAARKDEVRPGAAN
uniref:Uncharacterized protein n=1 Tax=Arundo donax TaxID=35708 RepID=A0A0A9B559_ARUDO